MLIFQAIGDWPRTAVRANWTADSRPIVPHVEQLIDAAWRQASARPGVHLFDGPMCRLEGWDASPDRLELRLSKTSYKAFLGTNLCHPELADSFGRQILANPVGVSPLLLSSDGFIMMGRRNDSVAYYPRRIHPFAGALEERDNLDIFAALARELREELRLGPEQIVAARCTGIAEDISIRQPELILRAATTLTRAQIKGQLDAAEHESAWSIPATRRAVDAALSSPASALLTPVAIAALLLWGHIEFGEEWFARHRP